MALLFQSGVSFIGVLSLCSVNRSLFSGLPTLSLLFTEVLSRATELWPTFNPVLANYSTMETLQVPRRVPSTAQGEAHVHIQRKAHTCQSCIPKCSGSDTPNRQKCPHMQKTFSPSPLLSLSLTHTNTLLALKSHLIRASFQPGMVATPLTHLLQ